MSIPATTPTRPFRRMTAPPGHQEGVGAATRPRTAFRPAGWEHYLPGARRSIAPLGMTTRDGKRIVSPAAWRGLPGRRRHTGTGTAGSLPGRDDFDVVRLDRQGLLDCLV